MPSFSSIDAIRPFPNVVEFSHGTFLNRNGLSLYYRGWKSPNQEFSSIKALVIHVHGMSSHSEPYILMADMLDSQILTLALDLHGHGKSEGIRGDYNRFLGFVDDLEDFLIFLIHETSPIFSLISNKVPVILSGESMGALVVAHYLGRNYVNHYILPLQKSIFWSPAFKPNFTSGHSENLWLGLKTGINLVFNPNALTHDVDHSLTFKNPFIKAYHDTDPLVLKRTSVRYLWNIKVAMDRLERDKIAQKITLPCLIMQPTADFLVSPIASQEFFQHLPNQKSQIYLIKNAWHHLFSDVAFTQNEWKKINGFILSE